MVEIKRKPETHYDRVLKHLKDFGSITSLEAFQDYGITRLSATIYDLRKDGYIIHSQDVSCINRYGKKVYFAKYILMESDLDV